jgi:signal transduction histidine kinase
MTEAMHGTVVVEDTPGGGATFVIDLPISGPAPSVADLAPVLT